MSSIFVSDSSVAGLGQKRGGGLTPLEVTVPGTRFKPMTDSDFDSEPFDTDSAKLAAAPGVAASFVVAITATPLLCSSCLLLMNTT